MLKKDICQDCNKTTPYDRARTDWSKVELHSHVYCHQDYSHASWTAIFNTKLAWEN